MPPSTFRKLLTAIHLLVIMSFVMQSVAPIAATAATLSATNARAQAQGEPPVEEEIPPIGLEGDTPYDPEIPAPIIPIPESDNPFDPATPPVEIPMDGMWGEGETPDPGPSPELLGTTNLPATPVDLNIELDRYILLPGEEATLSVSLLQAGEAASTPVQVTLTLPPQLQIVGDPEASKVWSYSADELALGVNHSFSIKIRDGFTASSAAVVDLWLEASAPDYEPRNQRWVVGIPDTMPPLNGEANEMQALQSTAGAVLHTSGLTLLAPESAAPAGVQIQYTPIYTGPLTADEGESLTESTSITSVQPITLEQSSIPQQNAEHTDVYLPSLHQDLLPIATGATTQDVEIEEVTEATTSTIPTLQNNGLSVYRLWHLSAEGLVGTASNNNVISDEEQDPEHPEFANPVLMVVDVADLEVQGVNMDLMALWTRPDETQDWRPVPFARYDEERQSWVAWLDHFSDFALGIAPSANGEFLPSMKSYTIDHQTGSANFTFPIDAPSGLGGLNPNISLNYSSQAVNDLFMALGHDNINDVQANMVGYGWNLGGMNSITKIRGNDNLVYYALNLNGQSYDIREIAGQPGKYDTDPISFAAIKFTHNTSTSEWEIKTPDGTLYEFGGTLPNVNWPSTLAERDAYIEMHINMVSGTRTREVTAWHLRRVEDTMGNTMDYTVTTQRGAITDGSCLPPGVDNDDPDDDPFRWYTRAARLSQVTYSSNTGKYGDEVDATLRVRFEYASRSDTNIVNDCQPRKTNLRLLKIYVEARQYNSTTAWHTIRRYELAHRYPTGPQSGNLRHLLLEYIHEYGKDSTTTILNSHTFAYTELNEPGSNDTEYNIHLSAADNGYGGKVTYTYVDWNVECTGGDATCQNHKQRLVSKMQLEDGQGNYYITTFTYDKPHLRVQAGRLIYMGSSYVTSNVYQPTTNPSGTLVLARFEEYAFHRGVHHNPEAAEGRLKTMLIRDRSGTGNIPYYEANYIWDSFIRDTANSQWDITTFNWVQPIWTRLARKSEWTGGPAEGSGRQERYFYESGYASIFGNVIRVDEYSHAESNVSLPIEEWKAIYDTGVVLLRRTKTDYFPNTGWLTNASAPYIVDRPARVIVENGSNACQSEGRIIYANPSIAYQNRDGIYNASPATAIVIKTEQVIAGCPYTSPNPGYRQDSNLIVIAYSVDGYGNQSSRTSNDLTAGHVTITTVYDPFYHLFPIERFNNADLAAIAKASYYGVNGVAVDITRGFWGAMNETCEINNICSRFSYDQFGRRIHQWDRQVGGSGWPTDANATVRWAYRKAGDPAFPGLTTYIVTEWRAPRCEGNFVRRHYDGLGQLVIEQKSYQDYETNVDGCTPNPTGPTTTGREIVTFFKYNAQGLQSEATVPRLYTHPYTYYAPAADWSVKSITYHDPLGRVIRTIAPNGEQVDTTYNGRVTTVVGLGRYGDLNKTLRWSQVNALGYQRHVRAVYWNTTVGIWRHHAQLNFTTDVLGRVTQVQHTGVNSASATYVVGTNNYTYDQVGRMTRMEDMDMGTWNYVYNRHSQLVRQEDGRNQYTCLYYDDYGRLTGKGYNGTNSSCPGSVAASNSERFTYGPYNPTSTASGQLTQISLRGLTEYYRKTIAYDNVGLVETETVLYPSAAGSPQYLARYDFDNISGRLLSIRYPVDSFNANGELAVYWYNGMGLVKAITSNEWGGAVVDTIGYDELGRITSMRYAVGPDLYLTQRYYPWSSGSSRDSNARLRDISVGSAVNNASVLSLAYNYDSFGNITSYTEDYPAPSTGPRTLDYTYDVYNRLHRVLLEGTELKRYQTKEDGRPSTYEGQTNNYNNYAGTQPYAVHSVIADGNTLYYTRDANGNAITREYMNGSTKVSQELVWNGANQLARVEVNNQAVEAYWYDENGIRVRKHVYAGAVETHYPFPFYQVEGTTPTRAYLLNGQPVALRIAGGFPTYLHHDQVGSVVQTTYNGSAQAQRRYWPYGRKRGGDEFVFEQNYTGQRLDDTGLLYYNARYYDPQLGQFISPDTIIPDPTDYFSYNRYLYGRGNPVSNNDPTGHFVETVLDVVDIGWSAWDLWNEPSWANAGYLGWSIGAAVLPFVPGAWTAKVGKIAFRGIKYAGVFDSLPGFEKGVAEYLGSKGLDIIGLGEDGVRQAFGIPKGGKAIDFVSVSENGRLYLSEVKASLGDSGAEIGTALQQLQSTVDAIYKNGVGTNALQGVKIGQLEIVIPTGANLKGNYTVQGDLLFRVTDEGTQMVRIDGNPIHIRELPFNGN